MSGLRQISLLKKIFFVLALVPCGLHTVSAQHLPTIFQPGVISTGDYESHPAFTPTRDTLYFIKLSNDLKLSAICVSYYRNKHWTAPNVAAFSGMYMDADPFVTKDGRHLLFMSNRPLHTGQPVKNDTDIWQVDITAGSSPRPCTLRCTR